MPYSQPLATTDTAQPDKAPRTAPDARNATNSTTAAPEAHNAVTGDPEAVDGDLSATLRDGVVAAASAYGSAAYRHGRRRSQLDRTATERHAADRRARWADFLDALDALTDRPPPDDDTPLVTCLPGETTWC